MDYFKDFNLSKQLFNAIDELGFTNPTPIQKEAYPVISSGRDVVGISQTGTGKTLAFLMPILNVLKFSKQKHPRVLILAPTRELVVQIVDLLEQLNKYNNLTAMAVYGGTNINTQSVVVEEGADIMVATPGRLYDLVLNRSIRLKSIQKLVIDEVDVMLDLGFRTQLKNIFDLLPERRQNIMFSATMTDEVNLLLEDFFVNPINISIAVSGTPLENITQECYHVQNFYTKINLLAHLLADKEEFTKVVVFVSSKKNADKLYEAINEKGFTKVGLIHSNKTQNYRLDAVTKFDSGENRILIATDVISRGIDFDKLSHVISFDTPPFPENYMHRIGRTGRAGNKGKSILFFTAQEEEYKVAVEELMNFDIPEIDFPEEVELNVRLLPEERPRIRVKQNRKTTIKKLEDGFHEKSLKNQKVNLGGSYKREIKFKFKKPKTRGDKIANQRKKKK
jgi:ATP-dependent RNA helicase RhlE